MPVRARAAAVERARRDGLLAASPGSWYNEGPTSIGGRVTSLAVDPNDAAHLWLGAADGGVFTSHNGGADWVPVFDDQVTLSIGAIAAHPTDSNVVYVGTGEDNGAGYSYDGDGVFKTTDGGQTWTSLGLAETRRIGRIAIDPTDPQRVFVAAGGSWFHPDAHRGVYRSVDGGATWEQVLFVADDSGAIDLGIDPSQPDRIYAAIWQRHAFGGDWHIGGPRSGVYRSTDGGTTWVPLGLPSNTGRIGLAIAPSSPNVVYALVTRTQGGLLGVYKSTDHGDTWLAVSAPSTANLFADYSYYFGNIRVDPLDPNVVYCLDVRLLKSVNGGATFAAQNIFVHVDWHDLILAPGRMLAGTDGGFNVSVDGGVNWSETQNIPITQFYDLGIDGLQPEVRFGAAQDNGIERTQTGRFDDWIQVFGADGMQAEVDPTDSSKVYGSWQFGGLLRSTNGGDHWISATSGVSPGERTNWVTPIAIDPVTPTTLYHGRQFVYRSVNSAVSWTRMGPDLTNGPGLGPDVAHDPDWTRSHLASLIRGTITAVSVSRIDPRVVWAGTDDGNVWVSTSSGSTWTKVNPPGPAYWVTDIVPDPFDAQAAYLSVTGYRSDNRLPYFRVTRNLGATWEDRSAGLPQVPINAVLADIDWRGRIFVGTDIGVARSDDGGISWTDMRAGLPYVVVQDLAREDLYDTLFAGTHGRSMYSFWLGQLPPADGDADGVDNNHDCALGDPGAFASPGEVPVLTVAKGSALESLLSWSSLAGFAGSATRYDVATGSFSSLATGGTGGSTSLACGLAAATATDPLVPAAGTGKYYLARARNACGSGSWGIGSAGVRASGACP